MNIWPFLLNENISLQKYFMKIYGLGPAKARILCQELGLHYKSRYQDLLKNDKYKLENIINIKWRFVLDSDLKKKSYDNIKKSKAIRTYRSIRHSLCLPVRGQNTKNNAKTQKWKRIKR